MKRIAIAILLLTAAAFAVGSLCNTMMQTQAASAAAGMEFRQTANELAGLSQTAAALQNETAEKAKRLRAASSHPGLSSERLGFLEGNIARLPASGWKELRGQLGIGWDSSPDYVLVGKHVLKDFDLQPLNATFNGFVDPPETVLALTPEEQAQIGAAVQDIRASVLTRLHRSEPSGEIVASYTIPPVDPMLEQSLSNRFSARIASIVGPDRADFFADRCWRNIRKGIGPEGPHAASFTIRRSITEGEPRFTYEIMDVEARSAGEVRFAYYPSEWFCFLFQGGWQAIAQSEGFELPTNFPALGPGWPPLKIGP
jgi:hypothetical protein